MRSETIARNYAEALYELGERSGQTTRYADLIDAVAAAVETTPAVQGVLMSPRVPKAEKARLLASALRDVPREFVLFLQALVKRGRQQLLREIADQYGGLLDVKLNRVRAAVTLARPADEALQRSIAEALSRELGKEVLPSFSVDPEILGGTIVRVGERVHDGSIRRRMTKLRRQLLAR
ncbi:MAG TPA: ATP synthase F1 subunit delta [Gemmatimonadales bacterium]|nr:ATP synthase F1 subunit delta [Gemmatimonadales bacterium]